MLSRIASGTRALTGRSYVRAAHVTRPAPSYAAEYERVFGASVLFGCARNAILLEPGWLALRIRVSPQYVSEILVAHDDGLLRSLEQSRSCRGRVSATVRQLLGKASLSMDDVARRLSLSRPTLYRALRMESTTFGISQR